MTIARRQSRFSIGRTSAATLRRNLREVGGGEEGGGGVTGHG